MREYIPKEEVLEIIRYIPSDLHEEYIYELGGIWIDEESGDMSKWIPVTKALPRKGVKVLVQSNYPNLIYVAEIGSFLSQPEGWRTADGYERIEQTVAWQPLPEPYKETESEE